MTPYQLTALRYICYFAIETAHPRFAHATRMGTLVLTVNSGYE
jgi:hypothetical protein